MTGNDGRGLIVQERDRELLRALATLRVIDREQAKLVAGFKSTTRANVRLLALARAGLLRRFFLGTAAGGKKSLYALSPKGAALVGVPNRGPRRANNRVLVVDFFVQHQLAVNEIYCAVKHRSSSNGLRFVCWLAFFEPIDPAVGLIPDGYFEIEHPPTVVTAFVEVDLGHEALSVWKAKVEKYLRLATSGEYKRRFGRDQFRVLVIARSDRRLESVRQAVAAVTEKVFWFATLEAIERFGMWSPIWLRPKGTEARNFL